MKLVDADKLKTLLIEKGAAEIEEEGILFADPRDWLFSVNEIFDILEKIPKIKNIKRGNEMDIIDERNKAFLEGYKEGYKQGLFDAKNENAITLEQLKSIREMTKGDFADALEKVISFIENDHTYIFEE